MKPSAGTGRLRCTVAYATRERQYLWSVELAAPATIADALEAARAQSAQQGCRAAIPWEGAAIGIFGERRARTDPCAEGDRIEIYRPLGSDPRARRREAVARERRAAAKRRAAGKGPAARRGPGAGGTPRR